MSSNNVAQVAAETASASVNVVEETLGSFGKLLKDFNVVGFVLGLLIANGVAEIAQAFIDGVLMPTLQPVLSRIGSKGTTVQIGGLTLHLEKFINALLKFFALALVIFVLMKAGVNMSRPVDWVRIQDIKPGLKLA